MTGRRRYRVQRKMLSESVLVLQVEVNGREFSNEGTHCEDVTYWRDARVQDLTEIGPQG